MIARDKEIAALCYQWKGDRLKLLIVTTSVGRWIIPKGHPEKKKKDRVVALEEALEEGGVKGRIVGSPRDYIVTLGKRRRYWKIYPVEIEELKKEWPEMSIRERKLLKVKKALKRLSNRDLAHAIRKFCKSLPRPME